MHTLIRFFIIYLVCFTILCINISLYRDSTLRYEDKKKIYREEVEKILTKAYLENKVYDGDVTLNCTDINNSTIIKVIKNYGIKFGSNTNNLTINNVELITIQ
jgi:hypothetical protein